LYPTNSGIAEPQKESGVDERPDEKSAVEPEVKPPEPKKELHGTAHPPAKKSAIHSNFARFAGAKGVSRWRAFL